MAGPRHAGQRTGHGQHAGIHVNTGYSSADFSASCHWVEVAITGLLFHRQNQAGVAGRLRQDKEKRVVFRVENYVDRKN